MLVILTLFKTRNLYSKHAARTQKNWFDVTCSRSCDQGKTTKRIVRQSGLRKTRFLKKNNPPVFFNPNFFVFLKRYRFLFFCKKYTKTPLWIALLHHAISPFSELHNNNLLYLLWHSNLTVKKCNPSLFSQSVVGQFTPKW